MTRSLIIAHQCTVNNLQRLEHEEVEQQITEPDPLSPPLTPSTHPPGRVVRGPSAHKASRSLDDRGRSPIYEGDPASKRASVWINSLIFDKSPLPLGFRRQTWSDADCVLFLNQQPQYFLQKWTDQGEHLKELQRQSIKHAAGGDTHLDLPNINAESTKPDVVVLSNFISPLSTTGMCSAISEIEDRNET